MVGQIDRPVVLRHRPSDLETESERKMKRSPPGLIYTILVDGNPVVALEANAREAAELCREEWFRADLSTLSSDGKPLCGLGSKLQARPATEDERSEYAEGSKEADASDDILFVYLVHLDGT